MTLVVVLLSTVEVLLESRNEAIRCTSNQKRKKRAYLIYRIRCSLTYESIEKLYVGLCVCGIYHNLSRTHIPEIPLVSLFS
jgi:hypothetical protein